MRVALINENSQASKNSLIFSVVKEVCDEYGFESYNYGMYGKEGENSLTYVQNGLLAAILLNAKAADFVITGCGTGEGAMTACNAFPGVVCGLAVEPTDAYLFSQINGGNALSIPFAKGFGWGAELNLKLMLQRLFADPIGGGYPKERAVPERCNAGILRNVKDQICKPMPQLLRDIDQDLLKGAIAGEHFKEYFMANAEDGEIKEIIANLL